MDGRMRWCEAGGNLARLGSLWQKSKCQSLLSSSGWQRCHQPSGYQGRGGVRLVPTPRSAHTHAHRAQLPA